ncbi:MAG: hypothetical protein K5876_00885 [Ruminiclostridium sp.]|nr:hypothetical protein [Ruminiclostridium sp.]
MFITDGLDIKIPGGDTAEIPFIFYTENEGVEAPYMLRAGQYAELTVRPVRGAAPVLTKTAGRSSQRSDGSVTIRFTAADTDIKKAEYIYTIRLLNENGTEVDTWLGAEPSAVFEIM